jgi:hypothetical protein
MIAEWSNRLFAAVYRFRVRSQVSGKAPHHQLISNPWHAVSIETGSDVCGSCCQAAGALQGQRFLSSDAPTLPLRGCTNPSGCQCRYRHHPDRRHDRRRTMDYGFANRLYNGTERRGAPHGRRITDV